ncbi:transketolase [Segetibacter aerophilus]|uniref:Transketolase n=1 Tax=Segetibacter aerophilus TaxID=670293 RepID=A0A512BIH3_9BACT|nr:transketolase [Segetibacter aerophilus]GEO11617.1 transketolase [Segetibacter aerophilus]
MDSKSLALQVRMKVLEMVHHANASHVGGAFSMADILAVLYNEVLTIDPQHPGDPHRDRFFLSKGHACSALYATLGLQGFFPLEQLDTYAMDGSMFLSHTSHKIPGVEISSGSLGHVLSIATGVAFAAKLKKTTFKVVCLVSDGELNEGSNWEPIMLAPQHKLDNLVLIIDYNKIQSLGFVKDVIDLEPLRAKFESFRWEVVEIDGHNHEEITDTVTTVSNNKNGIPKVIIAHTIKGKGVDYMENTILWHYRSPNIDLYNNALKQLGTT